MAYQINRKKFEEELNRLSIKQRKEREKFAKRMDDYSTELYLKYSKDMGKKHKSAITRLKNKYLRKRFYTEKNSNIA